jgi:hypothetical protein
MARAGFLGDHRSRINGRCAAKSSPRRTGLNRDFQFGFRLALTWSSPFVTGRFSRRLADAGSAIFAPRGRGAHAVAPFKVRHHRANARSWLVRPAWPSGNRRCGLHAEEVGGRSNARRHSGGGWSQRKRRRRFDSRASARLMSQFEFLLPPKRKLASDCNVRQSRLKADACAKIEPTG